MKGRFAPKISMLFLVLALILLFSGVFQTFHIYRDFQNWLPTLEHNEPVLEMFQEVTVRSMVSGSLIVSGLGILVIISLHILRRTARMEKEAEVLRKKNRAVEELNRQTQRLAHHQRLEIIGTLTSSIAHEFNNLLTPIMGYSMMALEKLPSDEDELYDDLLQIYSSSCKAKEIISRLSDLSRKNTDDCFRPVAPDDLLRKMARVAEPARAENVQIQMNLNCWDQRLEANEIQLSQMFLNLILNGFHAMEPDGGVLTLSTSMDESHILIQVSDTGCGIPREIQSKIFEPFFTTKESGKGTGLGLAIAAQVAEDHNGKIRVESKVGSGSVFTVKLPRNHKSQSE